MTGMTLVELVLVLAVMGVLLGFAAESFEQMYANSKLRSAQDSVAQFLRKARAYADAHATQVEVTVVADRLTATHSNAQPLDILRLPSGVTAVSTDAQYSFKPRGTASAGTITLRPALAGVQPRRVTMTGYGRILTRQGGA